MKPPVTGQVRQVVILTLDGLVLVCAISDLGHGDAAVQWSGDRVNAETVLRANNYVAAVVRDLGMDNKRFISLTQWPRWGRA